MTDTGSQLSSVAGTGNTDQRITAKCLMRAASVIALLVSAIPASAQHVWTGSAGTTNWFTPGNWTGGIPGTSIFQTYINTMPEDVYVTINGGIATANSINLGDLAANRGNLRIEGNAQLSASDIRIAYQGSGSIVVVGGIVNVSNNTMIGERIGSVGSLTLSGPDTLWNTNQFMGTIEVGAFGTGTLLIEGGAKATSIYGFVADENTGRGYLTVKGEGSSWTMTGLFGTSQGDATIRIEDGGVISVGRALMADEALSKVMMTVSGSDGSGVGSMFSTNTYLNVGIGGDATLNVWNGGVVNVGSTMEIGNTGNGILDIDNGSVSSGGYISLAESASGTGILNVRNNGSVTTGGSLYIGYSGSSSLNLDTGGVVNAAGAIWIATENTAVATLNIGGAAGAAARAPGTINTGSIRFGAGTGRIVFNHTATETDNYTFSPAITPYNGGIGAVDVYSGFTTLTGASSYTGPTNVYGGALKAGAVGVFSTASATSVHSAGAIDLNGYNQRIDILTNAGVVALNGMSESPALVQAVPIIPGTTLTVTNYVGNGGTLVLNTHLGDETSPSDKLVLSDGGSATGVSFLKIVNASGPGAIISGDGILVVEALGAATTDVSAFRLNGRVIAGGLEYSLHRGGETSDDSWYLRNTRLIVIAPDPGSGFDRPDPEVVEVPDYRVELPLAASIMPIAMEYGYAMLDTLHERVGEPRIAPLSLLYEEKMVRGSDGGQSVARVPVRAEPQKWLSGAWGRLIGERGFRDNDNFERRGPDYDYTFAAIQTGLDVFASERDTGILDRAGFYVGYGQIDAHVKGAWQGKAGSIDMDTYTLGGYWTQKSPVGWYTDAVIQGTWYAADAKSIEGQRLKPDGFGILVSLEGGHTFQFGEGFSIEPQVQLAYQNVSFDVVSDAYGRFALSDGESLRGRVGVRLVRAWNLEESATPRLVTTWLRGNVWHEFMGDPKTAESTLDGIWLRSVSSSLGGTWGEIGVGVSGEVSDNTSLFATGSYNRSLDNRGRETWDGRLGITVRW